MEKSSWSFIYFDFIMSTPPPSLHRRACLGTRLRLRSQKIWNCFFFLLKFNMVYMFWIVLMCWCQKWFLKNEKTSLACILARKVIWKAPATTLPNTLVQVLNTRQMKMVKIKWNISLIFIILKLYKFILNLFFKIKFYFHRCNQIKWLKPRFFKFLNLFLLKNMFFNIFISF